MDAAVRSLDLQVVWIEPSGSFNASMLNPLPALCGISNVGKQAPAADRFLWGPVGD
jgi:hypothetical protein